MSSLQQQKASTANGFVRSLRAAQEDTIHNTVERFRKNKQPVRVATIVCQTEDGTLCGKTLSILLVKHTKGGPFMLPQGEYVKDDTPFMASCSLLERELNIPSDELALVMKSCVILGHHSHMVPMKRKDHLHEVEEEKKLLVFTKMCVKEQFARTVNKDIEHMTWVSNLAEAESMMDGMRDSSKFIAERDVIKSATGWK